MTSKPVVFRSFWIAVACAAGWTGATIYNHGSGRAVKPDTDALGDNSENRRNDTMVAFAIPRTPPLYKPSPPKPSPPKPQQTTENDTHLESVVTLNFPDKNPLTAGSSPQQLPLDLPTAEIYIPDPAEAEQLIDKLRHTVPLANASGGRLPPHTPIDRSDDPNAAISLGNVTTGSLVRGKALPREGFGFRVLPRTITRGYLYGTDGLVDALTSAAEDVALLYPNSTLWFGNLSRDVGGDIEPSVSHNSGRDVDISFYACDQLGYPVDTGRFVRFDADGRSEDYDTQVFFDSKRNWALVRALLTNTNVQVQHIFVAEWLKQLLLEYAIRSGDDPDVVFRAERVLEQPRDSSPHAEHFHVRLYCELTERLLGCHDFGVKHPWVNDFGEQRDERLQTLIRLYQSGRQEERDYALRQLDLLTVTPDYQVERWESVEDL